MASLNTNDGNDDLDRNTTAAIRNAIGERLRRDMGTDEPLPSRLQMLLNELQQQDQNS